MKLYENPIEEAHTAESPALGSESDIIKFDADRAWWLERAPNLPPPPALMWNAKADKCSYRAFTRKSLFIDKSKWQRIESCAERLFNHSHRTNADTVFGVLYVYLLKLRVYIEPYYLRQRA